MNWRRRNEGRATIALRQRFTTALVLGVLTAAAVLGLPTGGVALVLAPFLLLAAWEWALLAGFPALSARALYAGALLLLLAALWRLPAAWQLILLAPVTAWWLRAAAAVLQWRVRPQAIVTQPEPGLALAGWALLAAPWLAIAVLHRQPAGPWLVLFLLTLIWLADSAAYFVGRRWGRHQLAPALSPAKTWEGLFGAVAFTLPWSVLPPLFGLQLSPLQMVLFWLLCGMTVALAVVGDLYESWLKRRRGLKDTGAVLPGHGGVLDRIDSTLAAAPVFTLGFLLLENWS